MTVSEYLAKRAIKAWKLAEELGVSRSMAYAWEKGGIPRGKNIQILEEGTRGPNGEPGVTLEAILAAAEGRKPAPPSAPVPHETAGRTAA